MKAIILIGLVVIFTASGVTELVRCLRQSDPADQPVPYTLTPEAERLWPGVDGERYDGHDCFPGKPCNWEDNYQCRNAPGRHRLGNSQSLGHDVIAATITECEQWANGGAR